MALPAPRPLLALLLLAASLLAEGSDSESPSCINDSLTVPRGQPAVMTCSLSTPLTHVAIRLSAPGEASQLIFAEDGPGHFSNNGWQLEVRGGEARLVLPHVYPAQAGDYTWLLVGTDKRLSYSTSLNVSEPLVTEAVSTPSLAPGTQPPPPVSTVSPVPVLPAVIVPVLVLAVMAVLVALAWRRRRRSWNLGRIRQMWTQMRMFPAPGPGPEPAGEQGCLAPEMQL